MNMLNRLSIDGTFAVNMIDVINVPANIKDASTRQYTHSNSLNLEIFGLKEEELIGKTVLDFDNSMKANWGSDYAKDVNQLDDLVVSQQQPLIDIVRTISSADGKVRVQRMVKLPIINNKQTIGIFTFCHNVKLSIKDLYQQYKIFHPKKIAIIKFIEHLKLSEYFLEPPTDAELNVLIEKVKFSRNKELSTSLYLAPKTIEAHLLNLRHKIRNEDLFTLLFVMRNVDMN